MSQIPSTEEILERMRVQVSRRTVGSQTPNESPSGAGNGHTLQTAGWQQASMAGPPPTRDFSSLQREIETALEGTRQVGQINPRNPGLHNAAIQFVKKVMRRSLAWYTRPLHHFQGGVIRALQHILVLLEGQQESLQTVSDELARQATEATALENTTSVLEQRLRQEFNERMSRMEVCHEENLNHALVPYSQRIAGITDEIGVVWSELSRVQSDFREARVQSRLRDRDIRRFFHDIQAGTLTSSAASNPSPTPPMFPSGIKSESPFDYFRFEELYRGDEALITTRQKEYLDLFRGREDVLDVGCGRGEFLELLRDNGISAKGVELGTDQWLLCREKALEVVQRDLFSYLESLPDESLGGLFSAQVIEHLAASDQLRLISLAYRKTRPGSPVVIETINAQCVFAVMRNFFLDPTHVRPVHPETLKFAMESVRFQKVELRFSSPMAERRIPPLKLNSDSPQLADFNRAIAELNELMYGEMDYAAIGWR